jgi:hypothetical protein
MRAQNASMLMWVLILLAIVTTFAAERVISGLQKEKEIKSLRLSLGEAKG